MPLPIRNSLFLSLIREPYSAALDEYGGVFYGVWSNNLPDCQLVTPPLSQTLKLFLVLLLARCLVRGTIAITANSSAALFLRLPPFFRLVRSSIRAGRDVARGFGDSRPSTGLSPWVGRLPSPTQPLRHFSAFIHSLSSSSSFFRRRRRRKKWWQIVTPVNSSLRHPSHVYEALPAAAAAGCVSLLHDEIHSLPKILRTTERPSSGAGFNSA